MKISTKGTYGLIAIIDIATNSKQEKLVSVSDIAARQSISKIYLEQVIGNLRKEGIIASVKGPHGGYSLNREPENITVGEILRALEGNLFEVSMDKAVAQNNETAKLLSGTVWTHLNSAINSTVDAITIKDILDQQEKSTNNYMFYI